MGRFRDVPLSADVLGGPEVASPAPVEFRGVGQRAGGGGGASDIKRAESDKVGAGGAEDGGSVGGSGCKARAESISRRPSGAM